jgi:ribonuclease HII
MRGPTAGRTRERALLARGVRQIAGVDEVERGCLAGPVVAAAVILDPSRMVPGLRDSKRLDASERERLVVRIVERATSIGLGMAEAPEIDTINILRATLVAMRRAVEALTVKPEWILVDALTIPGTDVPQTAIVRGDQTCASIAAASIVAKVHRDALMRDFGAQYPGYGFESHKGYATRVHADALRRLGATPLHRATFLHDATAPAPTPVRESD